ncbi:hypothetical protein NLU13_8566 [Sarocladium strictum]|uniref:Uncharacterized protein n=1 Tax=Sarocladium strictum TaxID=5046 RepID=A0AA39GBZ3_SARSR|nr:hypothetical protein NLU13_8566 [Sarocladium strictum]
MGWLEDLAGDITRSAEEVAGNVAKHGSFIVNAIGESLKDGANATGNWVENEGMPSLWYAANTTETWIREESLPFLRATMDSFGTWIEDDVQPVFSEAIGFLKDHPELIALIAGGTISMFATEFLVTEFLAALGFTAEGVAAGSIAAAIHSLIGDVQMGSLFAILQSAGTGSSAFAVIVNIVRALEVTLLSMVALLELGPLYQLFEQIWEIAAEFLRQLL